MSFDIRTLALMVGITNLIQALVLIQQSLVKKPYRGVGWWALGSASIALGSVVSLLRDIHSLERIAIVSGNALIVAGVIFIYVGAMRFSDKAENRGLCAALFAVFLSLFIYCTYVRNDITLRAAILAVTFAVTAFGAAWALYAPGIRPVTATGKFVAAVFLATGCLSLYLAVTTLTIAPVSDFFTPTTSMVLSFLVPIIGGSLRTYGFIAMINERLHAEAVEARDHFQAIFNTSPDASAITRLSDGRFVNVNDGFTTLTGYSRAELIGKTSFEVPIWRYPSSRETFVRKHAEKGHSEGFEAEFQRKDRSHFFGLISATTINLQGAAHIISVTRDITERKRLAEEKERLEEQLRQSRKVEAIGRLAGGVAHDFNNLTAIVLGYGELLLGQLRPEDPSRKLVTQIVEAGRRSAAVTRQLLAFSRRQTLQPEVLDLNALLRNIEKMLGRLIGEDIHLEFRLAEDLGRIKADPGQIEQVVTNLVVNARDAMPLGGRLTLETADVELDETFALGPEHGVPGRYVMLTLTDTGGGMDKTTMSRLFEPFFTTKPKGKGTGLGLATAYGIVKQSGGHISADSEFGEGTTFRIYLPRTDEEPAAKAAEAFEELPRGSGERILLAEDETSLRELCETVLTRLGYRVSAAENSLEALRMVREQGLEPDLVLTDVIMPDMNGAELASRLRRDRPGLKVLFMSGYPDETIALHGVLDPGTPFLQKPFTEQALAVKVRKALMGKAAARPGRRVLMIDDDEQFRELVRHFCRKRGHLFTGAGDPPAALSALAGQTFDVVLVDVNIPGTSGERVLREIRAAGCVAPAIMLTGDVTSADMKVLSPLGAVRTLEKSSNAEPLLEAIEDTGALNGNPGGSVAGG